MRALALLVGGGCCGLAGAADFVDPVAHVRLRSPGHTGRVNALAFSPDGSELYSAGNDKSVRVWRNDGGPNDRWFPAAPMRWEVGHGELGRVYALDADNATGAVAVGGRGSRGAIGELFLFDPKNPKRYRSWRFPTDNASPNELQHDQVVRSIAFAPRGDWFASADLNGQVLLWRGAKRQPPGELLPPVRRVNNRDNRLLRPTRYRPRRRPIAWAGNKNLVYPRLNEKDIFPTENGGVPLWRVFTHDPVSGRSTELGDGSTRYPGSIVAIAATPDGSRIGVAGSNRAYLYERDTTGSYVPKPLHESFPEGDFIHAMTFTSSGDHLLIGWETPQGGRAELIAISTNEANKDRLAWDTPHPVEACTANGKRLAFAAGNDVYLVDSRATDPAPARLKGGPRVEEVAFLPSDGAAPTRLLIRTSEATRIVDPTQEATLEPLLTNQPLPPTAEPGRRAAGWSFDPATLTVRRRGRGALRIPLDAAKKGRVPPGSWCWLKGPNKEPRAIAIGTDISGAILVYDVAAAGDRPRLLRQFIGHEGGVTSLAARPDGELLASGSDDGSASLWSVAGLGERVAESDRLMAVWGVRLEPHELGGSRVVELASQGPFFNRGVRVGDRLALIKWRERGPLIEASNHETIVERFSAASPGDSKSEPYADIVPGAKAQGDSIGLNFAPIWGPLISFYSSGDAWVAWTPTGHYDASVGGDRLIGWQFNKRQGVAPSFATAQQHHRTFRKPDLIRRLLGAKDEALAKAVEQAMQQQTVDNDRLPEVRLTEKTIDQDGSVTVSVEIDAPEGETVDEVALINGEGRKVDRVEGPFKPGQRVDLTIEPVDGSPQEIVARVYGSSGTADSKAKVRYQPEPEISEKLERLPQAQSVLYLLAVGVSRYAPEAGVDRLEFAEADAKHVAKIFESHPAYDRVLVKLLTTPQETTGERIREGLDWLRETADGNDTIGLFFAGHSRVNSADVCLLPSDGDAEGLTSAELIDSCFDLSTARKVLILDSCNSGRFREAIRGRAQQNDDSDVGVSLFASCAADELAREDTETGSGVFTNLIVRGLGGAAGRRSGSAVSDIDLAGFLRQDREAKERFSSSLQKPVVYIPFAFERQSDLPLTKPPR